MQFSATGDSKISGDFSRYMHLQIYARLFNMNVSFSVDLTHRPGSNIGAVHNGSTFGYDHSDNSFYYCLAQVNKEKTVITLLYSGYYKIDMGSGTLAKHERQNNPDYVVTRIDGLYM